jgi:hypothetical protein
MSYRRNVMARTYFLDGFGIGAIPQLHDADFTFLPLHTVDVVVQRGGLVGEVLNQSPEDADAGICVFWFDPAGDVDCEWGRHLDVI